MKYSNSLPKITFESTLGDFTISSFFSFYEYDYKKINTTKTYVDNKTTLTELSYKIYQDNNSMWLFLIANDFVDPFDLLATNVTIQTEKIKNNINLGLYLNPTTDSNYLQPVGSILTPYSATGGSAWQYSSVGNFDLDGPFTLVDSTDYYTAKMVIKEQLGDIEPFITTDPETSENIVTVQNDTSGFTCDDVVYNTKSKKPQLDNSVNISTSDSNVISPGDSNYATFAFATPTVPSYGNDGATAEITDYEKLLAQNRTIKVIPPISISSIFNNLKKMSFT